MGTSSKTLPNKQTASPKAIIHKKYGAKAIYRVEEISDQGENPCPGLVINRQIRVQFRCFLDLPDLSVSSGLFSKKKDAEQSAAQIAVEKLGLQENVNDPTPEEAFNELVKRLNIVFNNEFLSSTHPLTGHLISSLKRNGTNYFGTIPIAAISTGDAKINSLCKIINPNCESDPLLSLSLISKASKASESLSTTGLWIQNSNPYSIESVEPLLSCQADALKSVQIKVLNVPVESKEEVNTLRIDLDENRYYLDQIAKLLEINDPSHILISRVVGKASSEMRFYFAAPQFLLCNLDEYRSSGDLDAMINERASYLSGQIIYGNAIMANLGFTWRSSSLFYEDMSSCVYYKMLLLRLPQGNYKLSRESLLVSELPFSYSRTNWRGSAPKDILSSFCRNHRLSEPIFSVDKVPETGDLQCEVKVVNRREEPLIVCSFSDAYRRESDAIQSSALKVLNWFREFFVQLDSLVEKISSFGIENAKGFQIYAETISQEFSTWISLYSKSFFKTQNSNEITQNGVVLLNIEGNDSGVFSSIGSLSCISYEIYLIKRNDSNLRHLVERNEEFEFEFSTGAVIPQVESCITQISVDQSAKFTLNLPSKDLILAASDFSHLSLDEEWLLEYNVKLIRVIEPMEERMEKAFFNPPLSKQRVLFAVEIINKSDAFSLVDFGCGSGSLLDSLLDHNTCLKKVVGVDISIRALTRAAKVLHQKLSKNCPMQACLESAVLYDGSIVDLDARLYNFDIATCLEVIEHMEDEEQAHLFGDIALSLFCPKILIVSTPNYEYNPILQRSSNKDEDSEEKDKEKSFPCKFRNFDHKFEWTREQFEIWANNLASKHDYRVEFSGVGGSGEIEPGFASQIAVFKRGSNSLRELQGNELQGLEVEKKKYDVVWEWEGNNNNNKSD